MKSKTIETGDLSPRIMRDISRIASSAYAEDGTSLYDSISIKTRDIEIIKEIANARDSQLRKRLRFALQPNATKSGVAEGSITYSYALSLHDKFDENMLDVAKQYICEYIVRGVTFEWCKRHGLQTAEVDALEVLGIEDSILSVLRSPSYTRRPLQPFGPQK